MPLTRRAFLAGTAGVALLAACGGDDGGADDGSDDGTTPPDETINLLALSAPSGVLVAGVPQRIPFGLADFEGAPLPDAPRSLDFQVTQEDGTPIGDPLTVERRDAGLPLPYFPVTTTFESAGNYGVTTTVEGQELEPRLFTVTTTEEVTIPQVGDAMIPVETPTSADARGVDPICTRDPVCPLHEVTLTEALGGGTPVAFLIATPEFCQTQICGPVLDILLSQQEAFPDVRMVHAEPYANPRAVDNIAQADLAEAIQAYGLSYEPALFLAGADGTVTARFDNVFDETELAEALQTL